MGFFGATRAALAVGRHVVPPRFIVFDFDLDAGGPFRVWEGVGEIIVDGETYRGFGEIGSISDAAFGGVDPDAAGNITYALSGVSSAVVEAAQAQTDKVRGREVMLFRQFLDAETFEPLDDRLVLRIDLMDLLSFSGRGPSDRVVSLTAETIWTARNAAAYAYYSDRDQQLRFPGDLGFDRMSLYTPGARRTWPSF